MDTCSAYMRFDNSGRIVEYHCSSAIAFRDLTEESAMSLAWAGGYEAVTWTYAFVVKLCELHYQIQYNTQAYHV